MEKISSGLSALEAILVGRDADDSRFFAEIEAAGGIRAWWARHSGGELPVGLDDAVLRRETAGFWRWAADRGTQCARCPEHGGACSADSEIRRGRRLELIAGEPRAAKCARWPEWVLRDWAARSNVPPRYVGCRIEDFTFPDEAAIDRCTRVLDEIFSEQPSSLVVIGPHASGKTHLACALLREVKRRKLTHRSWYLDTIVTAPQLKAFFADQEHKPDPLERVRTTEFLILDNFDPSKFPAWCAVAFDEALHVRWDKQLATVIVSHDSLAAIARALPTVTGLGAVATVVLPVLPEYRAG